MGMAGFRKFAATSFVTLTDTYLSQLGPVGIDASQWFYAAAATKNVLVQEADADTVVIPYFVGRVRKFNSLGIKPFLVFDGNFLRRPFKSAPAPMKHRSQNKLGEVDNKLFPRLIIGIKDELELEKLEFECIVAPNEADGQLFLLEKIGKIKAVISEDNDMIAYGCKKLLNLIEMHSNRKGNCLGLLIRKFFSYAFCIGAAIMWV